MNYACQKCGQVRAFTTTPQSDLDPVFESEPTFEPDPAFNQTQYQPAPRQRSWTRFLRFWWIPVALAGAFLNFSSPDPIARDAQGLIISSGDMAVQELRVGDCFDFEDGDSTIDEEEIVLIEKVVGKNCSLVHDYEVYLLHELGANDPYPTSFRVDRIFEDVCLGAFDAYVGTQWEVSEVWADLLWPSEEGWNQDNDRTITCFLFLMEGSTTGSFRGSGR